jgi:hypothetical protein
VPRVPTRPLCLGEPLVQVKSTPCEPIPLVSPEPIRSTENDQLVSSNGERSTDGSH